MDVTPLGAPIARVDGPARLTGRARYVADLKRKGQLHAVLIESPVAQGRILSVDDREARRVPGVRLILTHENMPRLKPLPADTIGPGRAGEARQPLQDDRIVHSGQHLALIVAETLENAERAASLVRFEIEAEPHDVEIAFDDPRRIAPEAYNGREPLQVRRGDAEAAFAAALHRHDATYTTPTEHHNPIETVATLAEWRGRDLYLDETSRQVGTQRKMVARSFGLPETRVHVRAPIIGGAFGSKGFFYGHILMTAVAARKLRRPVLLVTTRRQMFGTQGHRPRTIQHVQLGAGDDGRLQAMRHRTTNDTATITGFIEHCGLTTQKLYATETLETAHRHVPVPLPGPIYMRAPGEAPGPFALESAMDELAHELGVDPVELRLRNDSQTDAHSGKPWSQRLFRECLIQGRDRFGWNARDSRPRMRREGRELIGLGCAGVAYRASRAAATIRATMGADGIATFRTAAHDVGPGTATAMSVVASAELGIPVERIRFVIGDSDLPPAPGAGGSQTAASVGEATVEVCRALKAELERRGERPLPKGGVTVEAGAKPDLEKEPYAFHSWGAVFAEVRVDEDLGTVRCTRFTGVYDVGRVLNARLVRSQLEGGIVWAIGMALQEHTAIDPHQGRYVNRDLAEYHVPVNADVPFMDISWLDVPDPHFGELGAHGVGEVGIAGTPGAIANAIFNATGKRVRDLPITLDKLL